MKNLNFSGSPNEDPENGGNFRNSDEVEFNGSRRHSDVSLNKSQCGGKPMNDMSDVKPGIMEMIQEERRVSNFYFYWNERKAPATVTFIIFLSDVGFLRLRFFKASIFCIKSFRIDVKLEIMEMIQEEQRVSNFFTGTSEKRVLQSPL